MKKIISLLSVLSLLPTLVSAQVFKANQIITPVSNGVVVSTGVGLSNLIASSSPVLSNITATSTTLQSVFPLFLFTSATGTSATTTNFATTWLCLSNDCKSAWPTANMTFAWPFTKQAGGEQATSTTLGFYNGFLSLASSTNLALFTTSNLLSNGSSTFQNFTGSNSTTTNSTSTNSYVSGTLTAAHIYDTDLAGATCVGENNGLIGTSNCVSSLASAGGSVTVSQPTGAVDLSLNLGHANTWTVLQNFSNASSTLFSSQYASTTILCVSNDCRTAWPAASTFSYPFSVATNGTTTLTNFFGGITSMASTTIGGNTTATGLTISGGATTTGTSLHLASTTLQNFTGVNATTTSATTTNFNVSSNHISFGSNYVNASTTAFFRISSTTLDAIGKDFQIATGTYQIGTYSERRVIQSVLCNASTTGSVVFRIGDGTNWTTSNKCGTTLTQFIYSSNNSFAPLTKIILEVGSAATSPNDANFTLVENKLSD